MGDLRELAQAVRVDARLADTGNALGNLEAAITAGTFLFYFNVMI